MKARALYNADGHACRNAFITVDGDKVRDLEPDVRGGNAHPSLIGILVVKHPPLCIKEVGSIRGLPSGQAIHNALARI